MNKLKIKNKDALVDIFKAISWLDYQRWHTDDNYNFINFFRGDLTNCEKILTHWICYIADRQMPFEKVWEDGGYVFSALVYKYSRNEALKQDYYEKYQDKSKERYRFKSTDKTFASRYVTDDYQNIKQTLEILNTHKYKRNIVIYIIDIIQRFRNKDDLLIRIAFGLWLLTYKLRAKKAYPEEILKILTNDEKFEKLLKDFKKTSTRGKKRLWCCIRDYKKGLYNEIFVDAIKEITSEVQAKEMITIWNNLTLDQIELPGDVWNNNPLFKEHLFADVLDLGSTPNNWGMPEIIRDIYNQLKDNRDIGTFYPEQFDVTFDFVPRMCSKKLCDVCIFGKSGVRSICIPSKDKYCPVALISCGYIAKCRERDCIIQSHVGKGICKGIKRCNVTMKEKL